MERKTHIDGRGNEICNICYGKIEGGYCDCMTDERLIKLAKERAKSDTGKRYSLSEVKKIIDSL